VKRPVVNLIKPFWHNLRRHQCIALSFDNSHYAARGVNYAEKGFMKLTPVVCVIELVSSSSMKLMQRLVSLASIFSLG
jgi:hypothetical protein